MCFFKYGIIMDFENVEILFKVDDIFVILRCCNKSFIEKVYFWVKKSKLKLLILFKFLVFNYFFDVGKLFVVFMVVMWKRLFNVGLS